MGKEEREKRIAELTAAEEKAAESAVEPVAAAAADGELLRVEHLVKNF